MKGLLLFVLFAFLLAGPVLALEIETQTSWYLGPGTMGPVPHWQERFYDSDSVAYTIEGRLTLMGASVDHSSWTKHVLESNPAIESHGNPIPADLDGDGDMDIVAIIGGSENRVVYYERDSGTFTKQDIGYFYNGARATTWPYDLDRDGDIDVIASGDEGLAWFENMGMVFLKHSIDVSDDYLYAQAGDMDGDGDIDIVTHNKSQGSMFGDLYLFRNDGLMAFVKELVYTTSSQEIWRLNLADFNGDSALDIQTSMYPVYVFLNDTKGHFTLSYAYYSYEVDGSWPNDFDADGDMDIMCATWGGSGYPCPLFWLENDGTGLNFTYNYIGGDDGSYGDGGMATDVNLDGRMDALGTYRYVGWFEQLEDGTFAEHRLPDSYYYDSHWVYGDNLDGEVCNGDVDIDILAGTNGEYAWWENSTVTFAVSGWLESSILDGLVTRVWTRFGWDDCVPRGSELTYRVRSGKTVEELLAKPYSSPILFSGDTLCKYDVGMGQYFQYRIDFSRAPGELDRSPLVYEVWVESEEYSPPSLVTGGGWIPAPSNGTGGKGTFGFNAHTERGVTWGQLQFIDHLTKMQVHSDTIDMLIVYADTAAEFGGFCRVDHASGHPFRCYVVDRGEPGRGSDYFELEFYDEYGELEYSAGGTLGGGNIQVHVFPVEGIVDKSFEQGIPGGASGLPADEFAERPRGVSDLPYGPRGDMGDASDLGESRGSAGDGTDRASDLSIERESGLTQSCLGQNYPNPFNSSTVITYELKEEARVSLRIYSTAGELVRTLAEGVQPAGSHALEWNAKDELGLNVRTGIYICKLSAGNVLETKKMILVR
jgi:hypothetical protein